MSGFSILVVTAFVLAFTYLVGFCYRPPSFLKSLVKTGSVGLLAGAAFVAGGHLALIIALALCALGDALLSLGSRHGLMMGIGAFALGHIGFIAAFLLHPLAQPALAFAMPHIWILGAMVVFAVGMAVFLFPRAGSLRFAVMGYLPIIAGMGIASLILPQHDALVLVIPGAFLFVFSDFVLSFELFVLQNDSKWRRITPFVVWTTYWTAQLFLLAGLTGQVVAGL